MKTLRFAALRGDDGWQLRCEELPGVTLRVARLSNAHVHARRAAASAFGLPAADLEIVIAPELPESIVWRLERVQDMQEDIADRIERARGELAEVVQMLRGRGFSQREVSIVLGISLGRVRSLEQEPVEERVPLTEKMMENLYERGALRRPGT